MVNLNMTNINLESLCNYYNPHNIYTKEGIREVEEINIFENEKILYTTRWFLDKAKNPKKGIICIPSDLQTKRKIDLNLKDAFYIPKKREYYQRNSKSRIILYIPAEQLTIKEISRKTFDNGTSTYNNVFYEVVGFDCYFESKEDERITDKNKIERKIIDLIENSDFKDRSYDLRLDTDKIESETKEILKLIKKIKRLRDKQND
ncbi:unnamed protein product [marine sediment metagenome]|uniref:Uncharacterized protein n=1 Tax=marine sediment metagenome TaxID=412755 RepID=X1BKQ7_9ZZZZ